MTTTITREQAINLGGKVWTSNDGRINRVYFGTDTLSQILGLEVSYYKSGSISGATLAGEDISNTDAYRVMNSKVYVDDSGIHVQTASRALTAAQIIAAIVTAAQD